MLVFAATIPPITPKTAGNTIPAKRIDGRNSGWPLKLLPSASVETRNTSVPTADKSKYDGRTNTPATAPSVVSVTPCERPTASPEPISSAIGIRYRIGVNPSPPINDVALDPPNPKKSAEMMVSTK